MSLILPRRFKSQPQHNAPIDRQGLGKGIQLLFNPGLGPVDLATGRVWTAGGDASVVAGQKGKVFSFDGTDDYYGYTGYPEITGNVGTFFMWCPIVGAADSFGHVVFGHSSPSIRGHQIYPDRRLAMGSVDSSTGNLSSWFNTANRSLIFASGGAAATARAYLDGRDSGVRWSSNPGDWSTGNKNFNLGRYAGGTSWDFSGTILVAGYTSAVWGEAEAKAFHQDPWLLFKAPARRIWAASAGGTTHDLVGANAAQANSAGSGAISQTHALSGQSSAQPNTASAAGITQTQVLTGASSTQANPAATGTITQTHVLTGSAGSQANAASTGSVSQGAQFVADPATQPNTAGTGAITQAHALSGASGTQSQAASSASIAQVHVLAGAGSTQANAAAQGAISQGVVHDLTASATSQANAGSAGAIMQTHILVLAPSIQDNIAAASAIVQAHVLAASSATQGNSASSGAITAGDNVLVSIVERTAVFQRSKSVTVRFN